MRSTAINAQQRPPRSVDWSVLAGIANGVTPAVSRSSRAATNVRLHQEGPRSAPSHNRPPRRLCGRRLELGAQGPDHR